MARQKSPFTEVHSTEAALRREIERLKKEIETWKEASIDAIAEVERERLEAVETANRFEEKADFLETFAAVGYFETFATLKEYGKFDENLVKLLKAHFNAPNHTATPAQLAKKVGYANYGGVNLRYGTLGHLVGKRVGLAKPPGGYWIFVIEEFNYGETSGIDPGSGHLAFTLRRPVIEALTRLGVLPKAKR